MWNRINKSVLKEVIYEKNEENESSLYYYADHIHLQIRVKNWIGLFSVQQLKVQTPC